MRSSLPPAERPHRLGAIVLAAGRSSRMQATNKLLCPLEGKPLLAHSIEALSATAIRPLVVVTGFEASAVVEALEERDLRFVHNPRYAEGMGTSIGAGVEAISRDRLDGAFVVLGDMPWIRPAHFERLAEAFDPAAGASICVPVFDSRRGHPVLWGAEFFPALSGLQGDVGARTLLTRHAERVRRVPVDTDVIHRDVDRPEELKPV